MSRCVKLVVVFECQHDKAIAPIAKEHFQRLNSDDSAKRQTPRVSVEAIWYLDALSERISIENGPKGAMSTWAKVCNHTNVGLFVENLKPFFLDLYRSDKSGLSEHDKIVVFYEGEETGAAGAYTIELDGSELIVTHKERLPFSWTRHY